MPTSDWSDAVEVTTGDELFGTIALSGTGALVSAGTVTRFGEVDLLGIGTLVVVGRGKKRPAGQIAHIVTPHFGAVRLFGYGSLRATGTVIDEEELRRRVRRFLADLVAT